MPAPLASRSLRCAYCAALLSPAQGAWAAAAAEVDPEPLRHPTCARLWLGGHRYALLGRLAVGQLSDVFLAARDGRLSERVVIHFPRSEEDQPRLRRQDEVLAAIERAPAQGAPHFTRLLPQRVALGIGRLGLEGQDGERFASAFRWRSGFVHSGLEVQAAHRGGIAPEHAVWMWKRLLELLGFVHAAGHFHGAIAPEHLLVHARDHGVVLCGWSSAGKLGDGTAARDLSLTAQTLSVLLGGNTDGPPSSTPEPLATLLSAYARGEGEPIGAWTLAERVQSAATSVFGPPRFVRFDMPGWV